MAEVNANAGVYKLTLLDSEMNADVVAWKAVSTTASARDAIGVIYTATRQLKDLAFPTVSGRSIDVDADGGVEVDTLQANAISVGAFGASAIGASVFAGSSITNEIFTRTAGSQIWDAAVRTITGTVTVGTNNDKTGYTLTTNSIPVGAFAASAIAASAFSGSAITNQIFSLTGASQVWDAAVRIITGTVTVGTNNDKTGYSLAASAITASTFATSSIDKAAIGLDGASQIWNAAVRAITGTVTVGTNNDKTGYSLAASSITVAELANSAASRIADVALTSVQLAELAVGQPATTPTVSEALMFPYMALRNTACTFSGCIKVTNNAGTVVASAAISDSASVFERTKWASG